jgi:hypothetical protein
MRSPMICASCSESRTRSAHNRNVGIPRELYRYLLAVALGLVLVVAMIVFLPYLLAGSTVGWRDGRILLGIAAAVYGSVATLSMEHRFGPAALKLKPTRRQRVELMAVTLAAIGALVGASMAVFPGVTGYAEEPRS